MNQTQFNKINHICNLLGKRVIPCYLFLRNPRAMHKWQFNACRQTAFVTAEIVSRMLYDWGLNAVREMDVTNASVNDYEIQIWEADFRDEVKGPYDHAWIYLSHNSNPSLSVLIDVARVSDNIGVVRTEHNYPTRFLRSDLPANTEISRTRLSPNYDKDMKEFYTQEHPDKLVQEIYAMVESLLPNAAPIHALAC